MLELTCFTQDLQTSGLYTKKCLAIRILLHCQKKTGYNLSFHKHSLKPCASSLGEYHLERERSCLAKAWKIQYILCIIDEKLAHNVSVN